MAASAQITGSLYPTFELNPAVRRTARAEATPRVGLQRREARSAHAGFGPYHSRSWMKWAGRPGGTASTRKQRVAGRPWAASGPRDPKGRKSIAYSSLARYFVLNLSSQPAESSSELRQVAKARPICFRPQPAENEYEAQAEYFGPHPGAAGRPLPRGLSYSLSAPKLGKSTAQFSAPCQPHCGSAFAPPRLPSPAGISSRFCSPQNE